MRITIITASFLCLGALGGCANLAPDYERPALPVPATINGTTAAKTSVALPAWQQLVTDVRLQRVVDLALANNRDLRIAVLNIDKARAEYRIEAAGQYPSVAASVGGNSSLYKETITRKYSAGLGVTSYEVDLFGRVQNLKESALQSYLALEATQRSVHTSLIAEVANAWLTLATDRERLKLAQDTWDSRQRTLDLTQKQWQLGGTSKLTLAQAQAAAERAHVDAATYVSQTEKDRNVLNLLVGTMVPSELLPDATENLEAGATTLVDVPTGLASEVLLRRPDIVSAEHALIASYADIGVARAAFFPTITLTASGGQASPSLNSLFDGGSRAWSFVPAITLPIFNAGSLRASLSASEAARDIQIATYEKTVQTAFQEVADTLAERATLVERIAAQRAETDAYAASLRLSTERYHFGADSYLSVLDAQRSLYSAQQSLISLQLTEKSNRIALFKVLGGE